MPPGQTQVKITHRQVAGRLEELGVNMASVLLGGSLCCDIQRVVQDRAAKEGNTDALGDSLPSGSVRNGGSTGGTPLADALRAYVDAELSDLGGTAELELERAGQEFLRLTSPPWGFKTSSADRHKLGLRDFRVVLHRDGRAQRTIHVYGHVRLARRVVIAQRPLSVGNFVRADDVLLEPRVFEQDTDLGVARLEAVVGQQIVQFVPSGQMITPTAVKAADLVRRSRPVTVVRDGSGVQLRLTGVSLDSGSYGDTVRVRIGDRRQRKVLRGTVTGLATVQLLESDES